MKEITITYEAEVTKVIKTENEDEELIKCWKDKENEVKAALDADDVHVSHLKYFIRDLKEEHDNAEESCSD